MFCIVTDRAWEVAQQAHMARQDTTMTWPRYGHDMATIRPGGLATQPACVRGKQRVLAHGLAAGGESRYKCCIVAEGWPCVVTQRTTRLRYDAATPYDTAQERCDSRDSAQ